MKIILPARPLLAPICALLVVSSLVLAFILAVARPAAAHEFWIEPRAFVLPEGQPVEADLRNGEMFRGLNIARFSGRFERAEWAQGDHGGVIGGRDGDRPALVLPDPAAGLLRLIYVSSGDELTYDRWELFESFTRNKGFPDAAARHLERGLSRDRVREDYFRFCKALVAVGDGRGADGVAGMRAEIVALGNPYRDDPARGLRVRILQDGRPRGGAHLDVFRRDGEGAVSKTHLVADAVGEVTVPVVAGSVYLLDAVMLREGAGTGSGTGSGTGAGQAADDAPMWESDWASLTFEVPREALD